MTIKQYNGERTIDGIVVTVDNKALDQFLHVTAFTDQGFEWAYNGNEPRQLALALLLSHGLEANRAIELSEPFMRRVTASLDNTWQLNSTDIDAVLSELKN